MMRTVRARETLGSRFGLTSLTRYRWKCPGCGRRNTVIEHDLGVVHRCFNCGEPSWVKAAGILYDLWLLVSMPFRLVYYLVWWGE
jgi:ribosomal protein S27E